MITDEMVEHAAIKAFLAAPGRPPSWDMASPNAKEAFRAQARAVLEYAATLGPTREARLVQYRSALATGWTSRIAHVDENDVESAAHRMLAAERPADTTEAEALTEELVAVLQRNKALLLQGIVAARDMLRAGKSIQCADTIALLNDLLPKETP